MLWVYELSARVMRDRQGEWRESRRITIYSETRKLKVVSLTNNTSTSIRDRENREILIFFRQIFERWVNWVAHYHCQCQYRINKDSFQMKVAACLMDKESSFRDITIRGQDRFSSNTLGTKKDNECQRSKEKKIGIQCHGKQMTKTYSWK